MKQYQTGLIHGRFQVLHHDHVKYLMAGFELCKHLYIGITNPDPRLTSDEKSDPHRNDDSANPLTYYERHALIKTVLVDKGISLSDFTIVPFPINFPKLYRYYVPMRAVFLLSIYDDWGREKLAKFEALSLKIHVLWDVPHKQKGISATSVRNLMKEQGFWEKYVPDAAIELLKEWKIPERLRNY